MFKKFLIVMGVMAMLFTQSTPANAYSFSGVFFSTAAMDSDSDGLFDLLVCFGQNDDSINVNRQEYLEFFRQEWGKAKRGDWNAPGHSYQDGFASSDYCQSGDAANIWITWSNQWASCDQSLGFPVMSTAGLPNYHMVDIYVNAKCANRFDYSGGVDLGKYSMKSMLLHEVGHALGLGHSNIANALMEWDGPGNCNIFNGVAAGIAYDDATGFRSRYPGIFNRDYTVPLSAPCWN